MTVTCIYAGDQGESVISEGRYPKRKGVERRRKGKGEGEGKKKKKRKRNQKSKEPNAESFAGKVVSFPKR